MYINDFVTNSNTSRINDLITTLLAGRIGGLEH